MQKVSTMASSGEDRRPDCRCKWSMLGSARVREAVSFSRRWAGRPMMARREEKAKRALQFPSDGRSSAGMKVSSAAF